MGSSHGTLSGGEAVLDGWHGKDTGANECNSCFCDKGRMACTRMACAAHLPTEGLAQQGDPTLSNRDVLTFNALVHAMHSFILHMQALDRRIEDVLVMRQPLDLRRVNYV